MIQGLLKCARSCFWWMCFVYGYHSSRTVIIKNVQNVYVLVTENCRNGRHEEEMEDR